MTLFGNTSERVAIGLAIFFFVVGGGLRWLQAAHPYERQSRDERAYGELALALATEGRYGSEAQDNPWHWPPGAPALFAVAHTIAPHPSSTDTMDIPAAYAAQALVGTAAIAVTWALARRLLASRPERLWAAAVAAGAVGLYPPLVTFTGEQLSEPLGAFLTAVSFLGLAWAWQQPRVASMVLPGALLGAAVLVRADLLPATATTGLALFWLQSRRGGAKPHTPASHAARPHSGTAPSYRRGAASLLAFCAGVGMVLVPWSVFASLANDRFTPVTTGGSSALFVGTHLPGRGNTEGVKAALLRDGLSVDPTFADREPGRIPAEAVLNAVAGEHRDVGRDAALLRETRRNLVQYGLGQPVAFAGMMVDKVWWMWGQPARGGAIPESPAVRVLHLLVVGVGLAGILTGALRGREPVLIIAGVVVLTLTGLHAVAVSQPRYALTLMPVIFACGAAGWFNAWQRRYGRDADPAPPTSA